MNRSAPLTVFEWREFLRSYSSEFLDSSYLRAAEAEGRAQWMVSDVQREAGWLGYEPASADAILAAERRLGVRLPPSYRNFLLASNGWSTMAYSLDLLKVEEIGWFGELEPELLVAWSALGIEHFAGHKRLLERCLLVTGPAEGDSWLLDADSAAANGEWAAYSWWAADAQDPEPYDNFSVLVASQWDHIQ
jgi:hypothetical protein